MADYLHWDTQGPCPDGFHIPTKTDWENVVNAGVSLGAWASSGGGSNFRDKMKMPMQGLRDLGLSVPDKQGSVCYYRSSTGNSSYSDDAHSYALNTTNNVALSGGFNNAYGFAIRAFKNMPIIPTSSWTTIYSGSNGAGIFHNASEGVISISSDGNTWYTLMDKNLGATQVYNDGDTLSQINCGNYYQWGNNYGFPFTGTVSKTADTASFLNAYGPGNYYNNDTFRTVISSSVSWHTPTNYNLRGGVTDERPEEPEHLKKAGIYWNETLGLISLSNGDGNWITIADKNLGATTVYNDGATLSEANCGKFFQWGNNYGFPYTGATTVSQNTSVNASSYGPGNYYSNSTFRGGTNDGHWDSSLNNNLWGGATNTYAARQGPCNNGRHIPSYNDLIAVTNIAGNSKSDTPSRLKLAPSGYLQWYDGTVVEKGTTNGYILWSSDGVTGGERATGWQLGNTIQPPSGTLGNVKKGGYAIRPFANLPVEPDYTWTKLYGEDIPGPTPPTPTTLNKYITKLYHLGKEYIFDERISTTGINVSPTSINLTKLNQTAQITASVIPTNADDKKIIYTSSTPSIVSVSSTGLVKALGEGNATITVKSNEGGFSKSVSVVSSFEYLHWDTQGPAPAGYHVPTRNEWQAVINVGIILGAWDVKGGSSFRIKMKMPYAGERMYNSSSVTNQRTHGYYWSSTSSSADYAYRLYLYPSVLNPEAAKRTCGCSVRCFRNFPLQPSSSWTTIYAGSNGAGIYHNATEGVISISDDGQTWITIADKNLGATKVYNDGDSLSEANCGYYYQRGNNYGFPWTGNIKTSSTQVDASSYGPGNYYSSNTFIVRSNDPYDWSSIQNDNLWGGVTDKRPEAV